MALELLALVLSAAACVLGGCALVVARRKGPTRWAQRVTDVESAVADVAERLDAQARSLAKWRSRQAARDRRAGPGDDAPAEPDPVREPEAWRKWVNSGAGWRKLWFDPRQPME